LTLPIDLEIRYVDIGRGIRLKVPGHIQLNVPLFHLITRLQRDRENMWNCKQRMNGGIFQERNHQEFEHKEREREK